MHLSRLATMGKTSEKMVVYFQLKEKSGNCMIGQENFEGFEESRKSQGT